MVPFSSWSIFSIGLLISVVQNLAFLPRSLFTGSRSPFTSFPTPILVFQSPRQLGNSVSNIPARDDLAPAASQQNYKFECPPGLAFVPYAIPCEPKVAETTTTPAPTVNHENIEYIHYPIIYKVRPPSTTTTEPPTTAAVKPCKIFHHVYLHHYLKPKPSPDPPTTTPPPTTQKPCQTDHKVIKYIYYPQIPSPEPVTTPMTEETSSSEPEPMANYIHGSNHYQSYDDQGYLEDLISKMSLSDRR